MGPSRIKSWSVWLALALGAACLSLMVAGLGVATPTAFAQANNPPTCDFTFSPANPRALQTVYFEATATDPDKDGGITKWEWRFGDSPTCPTYCSSCTGQNVSCRFPEDGTYRVTLKVTAKDNQTCTKTKSVVVATKPPIANFSFSPLAPMVDQLVYFSDDSTDPDGGSIKKWQWDFGDRTSSSERNPSHKYAKEGRYSVSLTVTDDSGLIHAISKTIVVGGTRVAILITGGIPPDWGLREYKPREFTVHFQHGDRIVVSGLADGSGDILVHTTLLIEVIHPDNTRSGVQMEFCTLPLCGCASKAPQDVTQMFQPGKNHVLVSLRSKCTPPLSSTSLWFVRFSSASASSLMQRLIEETAQLQGEAAAMKGSWDARSISRVLSRALRSCARAPEGAACDTLLENARLRVLAIDLGKLLELVKRGLPELVAEVETVIESRESWDPGKGIQRELEELYRFLCGLDPTASDCRDMEPVTPVGRTWPDLQEELARVAELLKDGLIRDASSLLAPILVELDDYWEQIDLSFAHIRSQLRVLQRALTRALRTSLTAQSANPVSFALRSSLLGTGSLLEVEAEGSSIVTIDLRLFALDGRLVLEGSASGSHLQLEPLDARGRPLANGVYLYLITARLADGTTVRSEVRKLVILR
ncbi:MAG: PKD domain-containing protein [Candidatus Zipacnadales bacterium]